MSSEIVKNIPIRRMDCPTCILTLEKQIKKIPGVKYVKGNYLKKTVKVTFTESSQLVSIEKVIEDLGHEISYKKYPSPIDRIKGFLKQDFSEIQPLSDLCDEEIELTIRNALTSSADVTSETIKLTCHNGKVTLSGYVSSYWERAIAHDIVCGIAGVESVDNLLVVNLEQKVGDEELGNAIKAAFRRNRQLNDQHIEIA